MTDIKNLLDNRYRFTARIKRFDKKLGYSGMIRITCLQDIRLIDTTEVLATDIWLNCGKWSETLQEGDNISFDAKVATAKKRSYGGTDSKYNSLIEGKYKLERVTKVVVFDEEEVRKIKKTSTQSERERIAIDKAMRYGKTLWERTEGINDIILAVEDIGKQADSGFWAEGNNEALQILAGKCLFEEFQGTTSTCIMNLHEFVVWLRIIIDPHLTKVNPDVKVRFYKECVRTWTGFFYGD